MSFTPEQQEAMAACLRSLNDPSGCRYEILREYGIRMADDSLAPWLQPPDDSEPWDHPRQCGALQLLRESGSWRYLQRYRDSTGYVYEAVTNWHPTEAAARKEWNALCRRAAK